ncbi:hypothetical protein QUV83_16780 [Cellulomonas cellasea]|uniref:hypothetical protein n=1 Tax=Cellulomonas cellasea TaxID=43670 RepID=UPI0025A47577|nr:hypothetical protein [Cellulomonas cellasea]MDM8086429.1 hypothetical protein [Cellulomonas cellasea]
MPHLGRQLVALAAVLLVTAGCQAGDAPDDSRDTRSTSASPACNHTRDPSGGDVSLGAGFDYTESHHTFDTAAPITLCMRISGGAVRITGTTPQITVEPETLDGPGTQFTFSVTVAPGATGKLAVELLNDRGEVGASFSGPSIVTDATGWAFEPWGDAAS